MRISRSKIYKTKDVGSKKFVMVCFCNYKMVDSKTVASQVQKLQVIIHEIHVEGMVSSETFKVVAIIERGSCFERSLILWNMVKVLRQRRTTTKGKTLGWDLREGYLRS